ncbi:hypothetical protein HAX54_027377 [Datura stramonium]|uniref:Uncharacterized protein n=1 Tax=Datura stramonium TaxID=4076 RepID=A0ABS8V2B1_DATST|nr:hypothetical protein [Datura stramonium]
MKEVFGFQIPDLLFRDGPLLVREDGEREGKKILARGRGRGEGGIRRWEGLFFRRVLTESGRKGRKWDVRCGFGVVRVRGEKRGGLGVPAAAGSNGGFPAMVFIGGLSEVEGKRGGDGARAKGKRKREGLRKGKKENGKMFRFLGRGG